MYLTRKFSIRVTPEQEKVLWDLADLCRQLYNIALAERCFLYQEYGISVKYRKQQNALVGLKQIYPTYNMVYSKVLQMTLRKLDAAYKSYFALLKNGHEDVNLPRFRGWRYFFTLCYNQFGFKITKDTIAFSHNHNIKTKLQFKVPFDFTNHKVKQIEIVQDPEGWFCLAVTYEYEEEIPYYDNGLYQAWDLGVNKHVAVNTEGKFLHSKVKRPDKYWELKLRSLQSRRDTCRKGSRKWKKLNHQHTIMGKKLKNQTKDWQHKQTLNLLKNTRANTIIVGDLSIKQMVQYNNKNLGKNSRKKKGLNRVVHNTGHLGRFVQFLAYKAPKMGKKVIINDEMGTTKTCCVCGSKQDMPLWKRTYICENCGNRMDRDENSAINIMKRFLSHNAQWTGYSQFVSNLRQTAKHKTKVPLTLRSRLRGLGGNPDQGSS